MRPLSCLWLLVAFPLMVASPLQAASSKKPAPKKASPKKAKPAPTSPPRIVKGTVQMAGDNGQIGITYTIGKEDPLNLTLNSAEFTVEPVRMGTNTYAPAADQKLLLLKYTIQNPNPRESSYSWEALKFTAVDAQDTNRLFVEEVGKSGTEQPLSMTLKPAQKVDAYAVIIVPAQGTVPKLIVERTAGEPVLRYDLRGKIKGLDAPFADPSDKTGATAREEVPAETGRFYPAFDLAVKLVSTATRDTALMDMELEEGKRYVVATLAIKNLMSTPKNYDYSVIRPRLQTADGEWIEYNDHLLKATRDEFAEGTLKPGEETTVRVFFSVPAETTVRTFSVQERDSRVYLFEIK
jgi:hypothetical protein